MLAEFSSANRKALSRPNRIEDWRPQSERPQWLKPVVHFSPSAAVLPRDPSVAVVSDSCRGGSAPSRTADLPPGRRGHRDRIEIVRGLEVTQVANRSGKKSLDLVDSKGADFWGARRGETQSAAMPDPEPAMLRIAPYTEARVSLFGRYCETKSCATRMVVGSPQAAVVRFNDGAADPQSHARAVRLGGKEGSKDLVRLLRWQPHAGITDRDQHLTILTGLRLDNQLARPVHLLHRIDAVHH